VVLDTILTAQSVRFLNHKMIDYLALWEEYKAMSISRGFTYHLAGTYMFFNTKTGDIIEWMDPEKKQVKLHSQSIATNAQFIDVVEPKITKKTKRHIKGVRKRLSVFTGIGRKRKGRR
jgi:hypothetical protein